MKAERAPSHHDENAAELLEELRGELKQLLDETADLTPEVQIDPDKGIDLRNAVNNYQRDLIVAALRLAKGQQKRAAQLLNLSPSALNVKLKALNIDPNDL